MSYFERMKLIKLGLLPKEAVAKKKKPIAKIGAKKKAEMAESKDGDDKADLFFEAMRKKLKGKCLFCGGSTTWKNEELWRIAIAHLLPKKNNFGGFPSVAYCEWNWIELCWSCHTDFDSGKISWQLIHDSHEWNIIKEKLLMVLPLVAMEERKNKLYSRIEKLVYPQ